jgi:hypothetical protein
MKLKPIMFLAVMVFASIGSISSAYAQSDIDEIEKANIPFDFYAGGHKMPAGKYTLGIDVESQMITLRDESGKHQMFLNGIADEGAYDKPELLFEHSGETYALKEVKSDVLDLTFRTKVPAPAMESRTALPPVEVALNR